MALESTGRAHWEGSLFEGQGVASLDSGVGGEFKVNWKTRAEEHENGVTSPEELIAAAHATCFSMAFSARLAKAGSAPNSLDTTATTTFVPGEGITHVRLTVVGDVDGMTESDFVALAEDAKENCPVSQALKGNVEISLEASLAS